jgi:hypothetical protein
MLFDLAEASKPTFEICTSTREISSRGYYLFAISKDSRIQPRCQFRRMVVRLYRNYQSSVDLAAITASSYPSTSQTFGTTATDANIGIQKLMIKGGNMSVFKDL